MHSHMPYEFILNLCPYFKLQDWKSLRHSMTTSDTSSFADDIGMTSGADGLCRLGDRGASEGQSDICDQAFKHLGIPRNLSVPLADLEEFSENGEIPSTDDCASNMLCSPSSSSDGDSPHKELAGASVTKARKRNKARKKAMNGPLSSVPHHVVDMNGNGMTKNQRWLNKHIQSYEDLEKTFTGNGTSEDSDHTQGDYDMVEFGEKYFNVHVIGSAYTSALTKTVNMVRRKSNVS